MSRPALLLPLLIFVALPGPAAETIRDSMELIPDVHLQFANLEEGRAALVTEDAFVRNLSRFDLECRLQTATEGTTEAWKHLVTAQVRAWDTRLQQKVQDCVRRLRPKLEAFHLPLPARILLVRTTGQEEGGAAYCRGPAIVLADKMLALQEDRLERLLAHELFHVLSNQNPELRTKLYQLVGFHRMPEMQLPAKLRDRKITNPDAPAVDCWIEVDSGGQKVKAAPILYASVERYEVGSKRSFFDYLTFRLLVLTEQNDRLVAQLKDDEPVLLDPAALPSYQEQIGRNTGYVIHPDEILADNFAQLVLGSPPPVTPRLQEDLRALLKR